MLCYDTVTRGTKIWCILIKRQQPAEISMLSLQTLYKTIRFRKKTLDYRD